MASATVYRLFILLDARELATDIYFKKQELGDRWLKSNYLLIAELVHKLLNTRDFSIEIRRVR